MLYNTLDKIIAFNNLHPSRKSQEDVSTCLTDAISMIENLLDGLHEIKEFSGDSLGWDGRYISEVVQQVIDSVKHSAY
jgi:hypothetical protein